MKYIKLTAIAFMSVLLSCNANENDKATDSKETTTTSDDIAAQKKAFNDQSRACIALMNVLEVEQNAADAAGMLVCVSPPWQSLQVFNENTCLVSSLVINKLKPIRSTG